MGVEELHLFVRFCNVTGLFPFRMVLDELTGRFKRFDGNWRHASNYWFILLLISQVFNIILVIYVTRYMLTYGNIQTESHVLALAIGLNIANYLISILIPRLLLFRLRHLETALQHLVRIDRVLARIIPLPNKCRSQRRTIIGFFVTFLYVVGLIKNLKSILNYSVKIMFLGDICHYCGHGNVFTVDKNCWHRNFYSLLFQLGVCHVNDVCLVDFISLELLQCRSPNKLIDIFYS